MVRMHTAFPSLLTSQSGSEEVGPAGEGSGGNWAQVRANYIRTVWCAERTLHLLDNAHWVRQLVTRDLRPIHA